MSILHQPVMLEEAIDGLAIQPNGIYVDGTFGRGGHSALILAKLEAQGRLIALDQDLTAVEFAQQQFGTDQRFSIYHTRFDALESILTKQGLIGKINGILLDLGVSSPQLEEADRGFSFSKEGPLDMRMDTQSKMTASDWLARAPEKEIAEVLWAYGEERYARKIAQAIAQTRRMTTLTSTTQLAELVKRAHPRWEKHKHPATRTFQAIRIFINQEIEALKNVLPQALRVLATGGRLVILSFHSLEDRVVKRFIREHSQESSLNPLPKQLKKIGRAIKTKSSEILLNPKSRSCTLRIAEKII